MTLDVARFILSALIIVGGVFLVVCVGRRAERSEKALALATEALDKITEILRPTCALALLDGNWEGLAADAIPQETWDTLYDDGLIRTASDETGERWPILTEKGSITLRAALGDATADEMLAALL